MRRAWGLCHPTYEKTRSLLGVTAHEVPGRRIAPVGFATLNLPHVGYRAQGDRRAAAAEEHVVGRQLPDAQWAWLRAWSSIVPPEGSVTGSCRVRFS